MDLVFSIAYVKWTCSSDMLLAFFPGPAQLSGTFSTPCFSVLQVTESWVGPGNETNTLLHLLRPPCVQVT